MTIEEVVKDLPFKIDMEANETKEDFFNNIKKHFDIVAVKSELTGNKELTSAIDTIRGLITRFNELSQEEMQDFNDAIRITGKYIKRYSDDGIKEETLLKEDIRAACDECDKILNVTYKKASMYARQLEETYRKKYGKRSGVMNEDFFNGDFFSD